MNLEIIRNKLIACEIEIIYNIVDRSKYYISRKVYKKDNIFLNLLAQTELIHSIVNRYEHPEEYPFTTTTRINKVNHYKYPLSELFPINKALVDINHNKTILQKYEIILDNINNIGNLEVNDSLCIISDINLLQIISKRCHLGKAIAECKYMSDMDKYNKCNVCEIYNNLTDITTEEKVLERVRYKTKKYLSECYQPNNKIDVLLASVINIFKQVIIPVTKDIQVEYLTLRRTI